MFDFFESKNFWGTKVEGLWKNTALKISKSSFGKNSKFFLSDTFSSSVPLLIGVKSICELVQNENPFTKKWMDNSFGRIYLLIICVKYGRPITVSTNVG